MKEYPPHEFANLFPLRAGAALIELSDSIAEHGQIEPIVLFESKVLDGRRRQAAAIRAGKTPITRLFGSRPNDGDDALEFAFATNYHRRDDLTPAEKVLAAVGYANLKRGDNQHKAGGAKVGEKSDAANAASSKPASRKEAAKKFGVSEADLERAKKVVEHGVPELVEAYRSETVSVSDAAAIADEAPDVQRKALELVKQKKATTLKGAVAAISGPTPETASMIARDLEGIIDRLGRLVTGKGAARDQIVKVFRDTLVHVRAL